MFAILTKHQEFKTYLYLPKEITFKNANNRSIHDTARNSGIPKNSKTRKSSIFITAEFEISRYWKNFGKNFRAIFFIAIILIFQNRPKIFTPYKHTKNFWCIYQNITSLFSAHIYIYERKIIRKIIHSKRRFFTFTYQLSGQCPDSEFENFESPNYSKFAVKWEIIKFSKTYENWALTK